MRVLPDHRLQFDWVANHLPQFRIVIGMGFPVLLRCKDGSKVVADRHPAFDAGIVDATVSNLKARLYRNLFKALLKSWPPPSHESGSELPPHPLLPQKLMDAIAKAKIDPDEVVKMLKVLWFDRGSRAELEKLLTPTEVDLEGFREDLG